MFDYRCPTCGELVTVLEKYQAGALEKPCPHCAAAGTDKKDDARTQSNHHNKHLAQRTEKKIIMNSDHPSSHQQDQKSTSFLIRNKELVSSLATGVLLAVAFVIEWRTGATPWPSLLLYALAYIMGSYDLISQSIQSIRKGTYSFDIDLLMLLAAVGAAILGKFLEGAFLLFLFALANALEHYALGRARNAIRALSDLAPPKARILSNGQEREVPVEELQVGQIAIVRPGERIPVDGTISRGRSAVNQAPVTGESVPVDKEVGAEVFAGTVNGDGAIEVNITRAIGDRTLDRVIRLVEEAQTQKALTQEFTEKFERIFVPLVLVSDLLLIIVPPLFGWWPWSLSFYRGMGLLVGASPCALALGTPATVLAGIAQAARNGVLIKGGAHLENMGMIRAIAFDKTGTLTKGQPEVTDVRALPQVDETQLLSIAASVERRSQHPLAQAVVQYAQANGITLQEAGDLESVTGRGVRSSVNGKPVEIGSLKLWETENVPIPKGLSRIVQQLQDNGRSTMVIQYDGQFMGAIGIADEPRPNITAILHRLRQAGIKKLVMLTGDNAGVGKAVGKRVGVDEVKAELMPEGKVEAMRQLLAENQRVAMVGDGVNDAPALAHATLGIAMGKSGTAVALETADIALMGDDLGKLPFAVKLSHQARRIIRQNLYIALGVILFLILASTTGLFNMGLTVVIHEGSTLVVVVNALRLLRVKDV